MFTRLLVPTDGSAGTDAVTAHALEFARTYGASVQALYVVDTGAEPAGVAGDQREELYAPSERRGREATIRITDRAEADEIDAAREVREGIPHAEILASATDHDVDAIVMGTHGRTGADRVRLGSTTERVLTLSSVPVLSVRLEEDVPALEDGGYERIVVPTDGSDAAERAAETVLDVAEKYDATVHAVYVIDSSVYDLEDAPRSILGLLREGGEHAIEAVAEMARERDLEATTELRRGVPADELLAYASNVDAELLAMGTRGQAIGSADLLGSTTARVVRRSRVPVLTVG